MLNCEKNPESVNNMLIKKNKKKNENNFNNSNIVKENFDGLDDETRDLLRKLQEEDDQKYAREM